MALVLTKVINTFWMLPLMGLSFEALDLLLSPLRASLLSGAAPV
jgi:hypothetical protein